MEVREQIIVKEIKARIQQCDPTAEVILFGSRARSDHRADSDWDVLVVTKHIVDRVYKDQIRYILYELELDYAVSIDSLFRTKNEWRQQTAIPVFNEIEKEGVPL